MPSCGTRFTRTSTSWSARTTWAHASSSSATRIFARDAGGTLRRVARLCDLEEGVETLLAQLPEISPPAPDAFRLSTNERARVWEITAATAARLGYHRERPES